MTTTPNRSHRAALIAAAASAPTVEPAPTVVQDIWHKSQRVLRTIVQALVVLIPLANGLAAAAAGYLGEQAGVVVPGWVFVFLNATIAATALIMGLVARIMAVPGVNTWLVRLGLGSVPKP